MLVVMLALSLSGCDLYNAEDDTGSVAVCPIDVTLTEADMPCLCDLVEVPELSADDCECDAVEGFSCGGGT